MTLEQLIAQQRQRITEALATRQTHTDTLARIRGVLEAENQRDATEAEATEIRAAVEARAAVDGTLASLKARLTELETEQRADEEALTLSQRVTVTPAGQRSAAAEQRGGAQVLGEARTYTQESDPQGRRFLMDVAAAFTRDADASARLARHMDEERVERAEQLTRAVTTSGAPGMIVPQYLVDFYAPKAQAGRKFADQCRHHDLPPTGMEVYLPRQLASTAVDEQVNELDTVAESDYDDEWMSFRVRTNAGSQTISRQSVERSLGTEDIVFEDLLRSYNTKLDARLINAPLWGLAAVAGTVTYTDASPTPQELYLKVQQAAAEAEDQLLDLNEDDCFTLMHGRRWAWLKGQQTNTWSFINQGQGNAGGSSNGQGYANGVRGQWPDGGDIVTDNNIVKNLGAGTNQDEAYFVVRQEAHLWEDPKSPLFIRAEQSSVKKLGIDIVLYGYYAACFNRLVTPPHRKITGTGLVAPSF